MMTATPGEANTTMAVVKAEHEAFWTGDHEGYARCHLHAPDTWFWSYWRHGGLAVRHGWDEIGARAKRAMDAFVAPSPSYAYEATWDDVVVRVSGDVAWVTYDQRYPQSGGPISGLSGATSLAHELRILEPHEGEWKIAAVVGPAARQGPRGADGCRDCWHQPACRHRRQCAVRWVQTVRDRHRAWAGRAAGVHSAPGEFAVVADGLKLIRRRADRRSSDASRP